MTASGNGRSLRLRTLSRYLSATYDLTVGIKGSNDCPEGSVKLTVEECKDLEGYDKWNKTGRWRHWPNGCFIDGLRHWTAGGWSAWRYFGDLDFKAGDPQHSARVICKKYKKKNLGYNAAVIKPTEVGVSQTLTSIKAKVDEAVVIIEKEKKRAQKAKDPHVKHFLKLAVYISNIGNAVYEVGRILTATKNAAQAAAGLAADFAGVTKFTTKIYDLEIFVPQCMDRLKIIHDYIKIHGVLTGITGIAAKLENALLTNPQYAPKFFTSDNYDVLKKTVTNIASDAATIDQGLFANRRTIMEETFRLLAKLATKA